MAAGCKPLNFSTALGELVINGVSLHCPAWDIVGRAIMELWETPSLRGSDRLIPGVAGVVPYRRRVTVTKRTMPLVISGAVDQGGAPYADTLIGLESNITFLRNNVGDPPATATLAATLTMPSGATRAAAITPGGLVLGQSVMGYVLATLTFTVPAGGFV